jgi:glutaconate CoA-transferase subunit A
MVDAVVEAPFGAHPTSFFPNYGYDSRFHRNWIQISRDEEKVSEFIHKHVVMPSSQQEYLESVGGEDAIRRISHWEED